MTREELEKMDKDALIEIVLKQEKDIAYREGIDKWNRETKDSYELIIQSIQLVLNNYKRR